MKTLCKYLFKTWPDQRIDAMSFGRLRPLTVFCLLAMGMILYSARAADKAADEELCDLAHMPADLKVVNNIVYKQIEGHKLELMLFQPLKAKPGPAPLVMYIHGGGWSGGDRFKVLKPQFLSVVRELNRRGIICASIEYRLAEPGVATVYDSAGDCKDALTFLVNNAHRYGIDPSQVGIFGSSAGGHLALVTALGQDEDYPCELKQTFNPKIQCVAAFYPRVSFSDPELLRTDRFPLKKVQQNIRKLLDGSLAENRKIIHLLSPLELVHTNSPAILLVHGDRDDVLPISNSLAMRDAALSKDVPVELIVCKGAGHVLVGTNLEPTVEEIDQRTAAFFMKYLNRP